MTWLTDFFMALAPCITVMLQDALSSGCSFTVAVITAFPFFTAVTVPLLFTFATAVLLLFQVMVYFSVTASGTGVTFKVLFCPLLIFRDL